MHSFSEQFVGGGLWEPSGPTPLLKLSNPEQAAQDNVQASFEDTQGGRLQNLSGQPVPALHHLYNEEVLPDV